MFYNLHINQPAWLEQQLVNNCMHTQVKTKDSEMSFLCKPQKTKLSEDHPPFV